MRIGSSSFLLAVGAILTFAVSATVAGLDINVVGWVLMAAGSLSLIITMVVFAPGHGRIRVETRAVPSAAPAVGSVVAPHRTVVDREVRDGIM